jgi:NADH dehydrogenase
MKEILIIGGGYAGFYTAWKLEKKLRPAEAHVTIVDARPYMTYQPFLPEVVGGSVEARHSVVSLRRHLRRTKVVTARVTSIEHGRRTAVALTQDGAEIELTYDLVVVTAGAVTRKFPIPGLDDQAIGMKHIEEAVAIRDCLLTAFDRAAVLPAGPERDRLLTVTFIGGGFSGVEGFGEALSFASSIVAVYPELDRQDLSFHLVEAQGRILPEVTDRPGRWVVRHLQGRGGTVHLDTQVTSMVDGHVVLSDGTEYDSGLIVWTAGNAASPIVSRSTDLPVDERGFLTVRADLRVGTADHPVPDAWGAGDDAAVPDLSSSLPGARTVPNAQHAVRQGKRLADNLVAALRGRPLKDYEHRSLGVVATLGLGHGIFQYRAIVVKGPLAWLMHRGYHVLAVPTWERKVRVAFVWLGALVGGRDLASLAAVTEPRRAFLEGDRPVSGLARPPLSVVPEVGEAATREAS